MSPAFRYHRVRLFACALMVIFGVVLNRLTVCLAGMLGTLPTCYLPSPIEVLVTAGGLLVVLVMNETLPINSATTRSEPA